MGEAAVHIVDGSKPRCGVVGMMLRYGGVPVHIVGSCSPKRGSVPGSGVARTGRGDGGPWATEARRGWDGQQLAITRVPRQQLPLIADPERALRKFMYQHRAAHLVRPIGPARQLQTERRKAHDAVVVHRALMLDGQQQLQIDPNQGHEG